MPARARRPNESLCCAVLARQRGRAGDFWRLYPNAEPERYLPLFSLPRLADLQLASAISGDERPAPRLQRRYAAELLEEDRLALYATHTGRYYRLNDSASLIWLLATEGVAPGLAGFTCRSNGRLLLVAGEFERLAIKVSVIRRLIRLSPWWMWWLCWLLPNKDRPRHPAL